MLIVMISKVNVEQMRLKIMEWTLMSKMEAKNKL